jgi:hypothetical protein
MSLHQAAEQQQCLHHATQLRGPVIHPQPQLLALWLLEVAWALLPVGLPTEQLQEFLELPVMVGGLSAVVWHVNPALF